MMTRIGLSTTSTKKADVNSQLAKNNSESYKTIIFFTKIFWGIGRRGQNDWLDNL